MIKNAKDFFRWWTMELKTWFSAKFSPLATESNVNSKAEDITSAVSNVDSKVGQVKTETDKIQSIKDKTDLITADYAKRSDVKHNDNTTIGMLENPAYGLDALRTLISQSGGSIPSGQFNQLAKEASVKDGDDTAISVAKLIQLLIGTAAQGSVNDTLFKAIENIEFPDDIASEENATINKNEVIEHEKDMTSIIMSHIHDQRTGKPNCIKVASLWYHAIGVSESTIKWMSLDQFTSSSPAIIYTNANTITVGTQTYTDESCTVYYTGVQEVTSVYLAQRSDVKDGNDTAISVSKTIKASTDKIGSFTDPTESIAHKLENMTFDTSTLATKTAQTAQTTQLTTLQQRLGISGEVIETLQAALQGNDTSATLAALKTLVAAIPTTQITGYALQGTNPNINLTTLNAKMDTVIGTGITEITTQAITEIVNRVITEDSESE